MSNPAPRPHTRRRKVVDDGRPDHADFWLLSEIVLAQDAVIAASDSQFDAFVAAVEAVIDKASLVYMANQRAGRLMVGGIGAGAHWIDGFMAGVEYAKRKQ